MGRVLDPIYKTKRDELAIREAPGARSAIREELRTGRASLAGALALVPLAAAERRAGRAAAAAGAARSAVLMLEPVLRQNPGDATAARILSEAQLELGRALAAAGRTAEARAAWSRAVATVEPSARASGTPEHLAALASGLLLLDRRDEARPLVDTLAVLGFRRADFVALTREKGIRP
jgi:tetratricopeptide (TPR) repeat protein